MSNAGDEVWNWAYKPNGKNATPGGNMYNLPSPTSCRSRVRDMHHAITALQGDRRSPAAATSTSSQSAFGSIPEDIVDSISPRPSRRQQRADSVNCPKKSAQLRRAPRNDRHNGKPTTSDQHNGSNRDAGLRRRYSAATDDDTRGIDAENRRRHNIHAFIVLLLALVQPGHLTDDLRSSGAQHR